MKLYLKGHDYKYATEQMLLIPPRNVSFRGDPVYDFTSSAEVNSACGKVLAGGQNAWDALTGGSIRSRERGSVR